MIGPLKRHDVLGDKAARAAPKRAYNTLNIVILLDHRLGGRHQSGERHPGMLSRGMTIRVQSVLGRKIGGSLIHHSLVFFPPPSSQPTHLVAVVEASLRALSVALSGGFGLPTPRLPAARIRAVFVAAKA